MMLDPGDLLDSLGGSLLNDLLSELNAVAIGDDYDNGRSTAQSSSDDDDVFALLERELTSTYYASSDYDASSPPQQPPPPPPPPPGMMSTMMRGSVGGPVPPTAAAFVVDNQRRAGDYFPPPAGIGAGGDAWSDSISRFGGMSLVSDFLAADNATKAGEDRPAPAAAAAAAVAKQATTDRLLFEGLFDADGEGEYALEDADGGENGGVGGATGGLMSLLNASRARSTAPSAPSSGRGRGGEPPAKDAVVPTLATYGGGASSGAAERAAPPPPPPPAILPPPPAGPASFAPPRAMYPMPPPPPPPPMVAVHGAMMPPPPHHHHPATMMSNHPPPMMPVVSGGMLPLPHALLPPPAASIPFDDGGFPALGSDPKSSSDPRAAAAEAVDAVADRGVPPPPAAQCMFNNADPRAPPVDARLVSGRLMPPRDVCFVVGLMLRSLKTLDAYNDDYYRWSVANKSAAGAPSIVGGPAGAIAAGRPPPPPPALPNPVWKEVKVIARAQEEKFQTAVKARAKTFADQNKSLGQMERTNAKRPKALLGTPAMRRDDGDADAGADGEAGAAAAADSKYESGQQAGRIQLWKARVTIDKGYTALLSLIELRRLIQANAGATGLIGDLMVDVKANVDLLHSSLGVVVKVNPRDGKTIDVNDGRLAITLSMPKGRVLCARAIEEGILPHSSACALLPMALSCILSSPSCVDGEDRLIHALTGLILLTNPCVDPAIFCRCLDVPISLKGDGRNGIMSAIACSRMRMNLLHAILSRGKDVCGADSRASEDWSQREEIFRGILEETRK